MRARERGGRKRERERGERVMTAREKTEKLENFVP